LICVAALVPVWWGDGTYAALSLATGYTAALLLLATLAVTPIYRMRRRRSAPVHLPLRRSLGVQAGLFAVLHMVVSFPVHFGGDILRFFFDPAGRLLVTRFGLSNWLGLVATVMFVVLLLTSTDGSLRWLGGRRWKRLHLLAFVAAALTALHALGYQTFRHAWMGLTGMLLVAAVGLVSLRLVARRALAAPGARHTIRR
jgi:sulfoxide reductase heme-binding subunit YedZ